MVRAPVHALSPAGVSSMLLTSLAVADNDRHRSPPDHRTNRYRRGYGSALDDFRRRTDATDSQPGDHRSTRASSLEPQSPKLEETTT